MSEQTRETEASLWDRVAYRYGIDQRDIDWIQLRARVQELEAAKAEYDRLRRAIMRVEESIYLRPEKALARIEAWKAAEANEADNGKLLSEAVDERNRCLRNWHEQATADALRIAALERQLAELQQPETKAWARGSRF